MWLCLSCREEYDYYDEGTCKMCYKEAKEEELMSEIKDLKSKADFLSLPSPILLHASSDILLHASSDSHGTRGGIPAHKSILMNRSPIFEKMLDQETEGSRSSMIKISNVSYVVLRNFVYFLYKAKVHLDEQMAYDLLIMAEKYQVDHLKIYCEKFMISKVRKDNAIVSYALAHRYNAKNLLEAALSLINDNMGTITKERDYEELEKNDPIEHL